jgi:hypothetical protein
MSSYAFLKQLKANRSYNHLTTNVAHGLVYSAAAVLADSPYKYSNIKNLYHSSTSNNCPIV